MYKFLFNLYNGLIALFFIALGLGLIALSFYQPMQQALQETIQEYPQELIIIGAVFFIIGMGIALYLGMNSRRESLHFVSGKYATTIDQNLIDDYLNIYWQRLFPNEEIVSRALVRKRKIYIHAELPKVPKDEQKKLISKIEEELSEEFDSKLGYHNPIDFHIVFSS